MALVYKMFELLLLAALRRIKRQHSCYILDLEKWPIKKVDY